MTFSLPTKEFMMSKILALFVALTADSSFSQRRISSQHSLEKKSERSEK